MEFNDLALASGTEYFIERGAVVTDAIFLNKDSYNNYHFEEVDTGKNIVLTQNELKKSKIF